MLVPRLQTRRVSRQQGVPGAVTFARTGTTAYDSAGSSFAANVPRFDAGAGVEGTTNLFTYSEPTVLNGTTTNANSGVTIGAAFSTDFAASVAYGDNSADRWWYARTTGLPLATTAYVVSAFIKMDDGGVPAVGSAAGNDFMFVLGGAQINGANSTVISLGGGLYWCYGKSTTGGAPNQNSGVYKPVGIASTRTFKAIGLQLEQRAYPTPYVRTAGAVGVRAATTNRAGLLVEEACANLITANQSSVETNTTGFSKLVGTETFTRDTTRSWTSAASLRVDTPGGVNNEGVYVSITVAASALPYAGSVWISGSGNVTVTISYNNTVGSGAVNQNLTLSGTSWSRGIALGTSGATDTVVNLRIQTNGTQAITFYVDGLQLEQKGYATSWCLGGTTRNAETMTLPSQGLLNQAAGAVVCRFKLNSVSTSAFEVLVDVGGTGANGFMLSIDTAGVLHGNLGGTTLQGGTAIVAGTTYVAAIVWSNHVASLVLNGKVEVTATVTNDFTPAASINLGSNGGTLRWLNGVLFEAEFVKGDFGTSEIATLTANPNAPLPHLPGATLYLPFSRGNLQAYGAGLRDGDRLNLYGTPANR